MKNDERIIKYIEGVLTPEERITFEDDIKNSSSFKEEFEKYLSVEKQIKDSTDVILTKNYLDSILLEFRNKSNIRKNISINRNLGYAFGVTLIIIFSFMIFKNILNENSKINSVMEFTKSLNENQKNELLANLDSDQDDFNLISENITDVEITNLLQSELKINNEIAENYHIGYSELVDELSQNEAEKIYNQILNQNFSEEVNL